MEGFGKIGERLRRSTVQVSSGGNRGFGSGVVWDAGGLILTNAHVARGREAQVQLWDGRTLPARVASRDPRRDLAALQVSAADLEPAAHGDSSAVKPGELVIAAGNPLGFTGALSTGVVHSVGPVPELGGLTWIRAGVRLAPGNSGGPLADARGRVIGINTAILNGLGIAVPGNEAAEFLRRGPRPSLGVTLRPVSQGLMILEVEPGGAAERASLRPGDVLPLRWTLCTGAGCRRRNPAPLLLARRRPRAPNRGAAGGAGGGRMIRLLIAARSAVVRAALESLAASHPGVELAGSFPNLEAVDDLAPTVVLADVSPADIAPPADGAPPAVMEVHWRGRAPVGGRDSAPEYACTVCPFSLSYGAFNDGFAFRAMDLGPAGVESATI